MMMQQNGSSFSLRMKSTSTCHLGTECLADAVDCLRVMRRQEEDYKCSDFLERRGLRNCALSGFDFPGTGDHIDALCREKMAEWCYRVCDHFHTSREIVAFAFSFLDRFTDKCCCDRTAFKLASMTSLYMATKVFNAKQISISSLAELSRGEFKMSHIAEMERIILKTLNWRLNPPTVQSYLSKFFSLLPYDEVDMSKAIYQRAVFFAELSVYDYNLVTEQRLSVAVACMLNAMEGIDDSLDSQRTRRKFLGEIESKLVITLSMEDLDLAQERLWYLYACSAQLEDDDAIPVHLSKQRSLRKSRHTGLTSPSTYSPVSVHPSGNRNTNEGHQELGIKRFLRNSYQ